MQTIVCTVRAEWRRRPPSTAARDAQIPPCDKKSEINERQER